MPHIPAQPPVWWLPDLVSRLGPPETSPDDRERWTWQDGELGVFVDKLTHVWQVVAWTPDRSVTLRSLERPSDAETGRMVMLAGLHDHRITP